MEGSAAGDLSGAGSGGGSGWGSGAGEEAEGDEDENMVYYFLEESTGYMEPALRCLSLLHTLVAFLCIIGYNCLKVGGDVDFGLGHGRSRGGLWVVVVGGVLPGNWVFSLENSDPEMMLIFWLKGPTLSLGLLFSCGLISWRIKVVWLFVRPQTDVIVC